ncbi:tetratricopeptide repeat protein [Pyruvatibacter sp.]|uniref:tetratricopeptide repeat protein n=1 Tax=Pyruvatibacter sp. TaxID=1981328 RepID=UPI0032F06304
MHTDAQGHALPNATAEASRLFVAAIDEFNRYAGDPIARIEAAIADAPDFAMAHLFKAHMFATATEPAATAAAKHILATARHLKLNDREASHANAIAHVLDGNWTRAAVALDHHSMRWPHDIVALQSGHLIDFFRANARDLRDRPARALPHWPDDMPGRSFVMGMHAFGLEESGDYTRAEDAGRTAIHLDAADCWAHHAVAHVMEMQGRAEDGIGWMIAREPHWAADGNFFQTHNWWHRALFHLDLEQHHQALALYDDKVRGEPSHVAVDLVDASALLWRLELLGVDTGNRWAEIADGWQAHADSQLYAFNDLHAAMAYLGAGRITDVDALLVTYRANSTEATEAGQWWLTHGAPLIEGFRAFWTGDYDTAVANLHSSRFIANGFGGSHAQRDVIDWTLMHAALRGNMRSVAEALANERLAQKPRSPVNTAWLRAARSLAR